MSKILLIEDNTKRQNEFIEKFKINLENYSCVLDNCIGEDYKKVSESLKKKNFCFEKYSVIISHASAFEEDNEKVLSYIKQNSQIVVLFSGGISSNHCSKIDELELIQLTSKTFYSENIKNFLDDFKNGNINPLILSYGENWKLNVLLNFLEKLNLFIEKTKTERILSSTFKKDNPNMELLVDLNSELYQLVLEKKRIDKTEIIKFRDSILEYIECIL